MNDIWKNSIHYSQCWEDPDILRQALKLNEASRVLSITSGGCNTLTLLLDNPKEIIAIDANPAQNSLLELKISAVGQLKYHQCLSFLGAAPSSDRLQIYKNNLRPNLSRSAKQFWDKNEKLVERGVIHCGKLEKYFALFRKIIIPASIKGKNLEKIFQIHDPGERKKYYDTKCSGYLWRLFFTSFFGEGSMKSLGRNRELFRHNNVCDLGKHYLDLFERIITSQNLPQNFFLDYIITGSYKDTILPSYLLENNYPIIKTRLERIKIVTSDIGSYLAQAPDNYISQFNLSDVFEPSTDSETKRIFEQVWRSGQPGGTLAFWNNLVPRFVPTALAEKLPFDAAATRLKKEDRVFFYGNFFINHIKK